jgi:hypothetical protein
MREADYRFRRVQGFNGGIPILVHALQRNDERIDGRLDENQPTAAWVVQQLRETFGLAVMPRHLLFDRDSIFSRRVVSTVESFGIKPTRTTYRSPWQSGIAERWVGASAGSCSTTLSW